MPKGYAFIVTPMDISNELIKLKELKYFEKNI